MNKSCYGFREPRSDLSVCGDGLLASSVAAESVRTLLWDWLNHDNMTNSVVDGTGIWREIMTKYLFTFSPRECWSSSSILLF